MKKTADNTWHAWWVWQCIVCVTTMVNPKNRDIEIVVVYAKNPLTKKDIEAFKKSPWRDTKRDMLPSCLAWQRDGEFKKVKNALTKATGLHCYIVGNLC